MKNIYIKKKKIIKKLGNNLRKVRIKILKAIYHEYNILLNNLLTQFAILMPTFAGIGQLQVLVCPTTGVTKDVVGGRHTAGL